MLIWQHKGQDLIKDSHLPAHLLCCPLMSKFALVADDADSGIKSCEYNEQTPYNNLKQKHKLAILCLKRKLLNIEILFVNC